MPDLGLAFESVGAIGLDWLATSRLSLVQPEENGVFRALFQLAVLAFVFGGPILKGILGERSKTKGGGPRPKGQPRSAPGKAEGSNPLDVERGKQLWKELLQQAELERPEVESQRRPADPLAEPTVDPRKATRQVAEERELRRPKRRRLSSALPSAAGGPNPTESELEVSGGDRVEPHTPLTTLSGLQGSGSADLSSFSSGAKSLVSSLDADTRPGIDPLAESDPATVAGPHGLEVDADSLRQAILMSEILGPPVALRESDSTQIPGFTR